MSERTEHGQERHQQDDRPTAEAFQERANPREVYQDVDSGYAIYVGRTAEPMFSLPMAGITRAFALPDTIVNNVSNQVAGCGCNNRISHGKKNL
jgi:hypothetical protein